MGMGTYQLGGRRMLLVLLFFSPSLSHNQIGDAGAQHLAAILPGLPELRRVE